MKTSLTSLMVLALASPALLADISTGPAVTPTPQTPTRVQGNCDLLSSNTVRATFIGLRTVQTQEFDQAAPVVTPVGVFQVIDNLAYRRLVRYGDGQLKTGDYFAVALSRELPGQPANIADMITQMQPGEEAVLKMDHLYFFGEGKSEPIRPCSRMARRQGGAATATPAQPQQPVATMQTSSRSRQVTVTVNEKGERESVEIITEKRPDSDEVKTRMFINGTEVDPTTRKPLTEAAQPAPAPQQGADEHGDDTIVEQEPQPAQPAAPATGGTISPSDSF